MLVKQTRKNAPRPKQKRRDASDPGLSPRGGASVMIMKNTTNAGYFGVVAQPTTSVRKVKRNGN